MDFDNITTSQDLATELGVSVQTAVAILKDVPRKTVNRTHLFDKALVRQAVAEKNEKVLQFLGFPVDLSASYDVLVEAV